MLICGLRNSRGSVLVLAAFLCVHAGCSACSRGDSIAELKAKSGEVAESRESAPSSWQSAEIGHQFVLGDGVRTGAASEATVGLTNGANLALDEHTVIRFGKVPGQKGYRLSVEAGSVVLQAGDQRLSFATTFGAANLDEGSRLRLTADGDIVTLKVLLGNAQIQSGDELAQLGEGDELRLSLALGQAQFMDDFDAAPAPPDAAPPPDAAGPETLKVTVKGRGVKVQEPESDEWQPLAPGEGQVILGSRVRLPRKRILDVTHGDQSARVRGRAEVVVGGPDALIDASSGGWVDIEALSDSLTAKVPGGRITAVQRKGGSKANIAVTRGNGSSTIRVAKGVVEIDNGRTNRLTIGERATLERNGRLTIKNRAPNFADMTINAGASATIHDRRGRTAMRIRFGQKCPGEGRVEVSSGRGNRSISEGKGAALVWAEQGRNVYRVHCLRDGAAGKLAASGRLFVRRDSGTRRLPKSPTRNRVEADGRNYSVLYQNLLPVLTFAWKKAPKARAFVLVIKPTNGEAIKVKTAKAYYTLKPGALTEGTYEYWFEPQGTNRRSKTSVLEIKFDNAAPTAYISSPAHGARWSGKVRVAGVALEGWTVAIGGVPLKTDGQHRFSADLVPPREDHAIAIRLSHPKRGTHYYLRRRGR